MCGEPVDAVSREVSVPRYKLERWRDRALAGIDADLRERENDPVERPLDEAKRRIGERIMDRDIAERKADEAPFGRSEVVAMSCETSRGAGKPYGLERVCRGLEFPRSRSTPRRAASAPRRAAPSGTARTEAERVGCRSPDRHPGRPGGLALYGRGTPQGLGTIAPPGQHPRRTRSCIAPDAREFVALAASPAAGRARAARRNPRHAAPQ